MHQASRIFFFALIFIILPVQVQADALEQGINAFENGQYQTALNYWQPLANQNNPDALYNIGLLYMKGLGVKQDYAKAKKIFKQAAQYGSVDAAYNLGVMYKTGLGAHPSTKDAIYWWKQAAEYGHADSQFNYGVMQAYGNGVKRNEKAAIELWLMAAEQGHEGAIQAMAQAYEQGLFGLPLDPAKGRSWRNLLSKH
ncbi:MAG: sel1 repeat family protein [Gammaproteobacteria bacterium]|nr:sel1 repeat family protein [Gammaproteobacteria bacterium]